MNRHTLLIEVLPSYGVGRDGGGRCGSLIFGTNLADAVITGGNRTLNGQGQYWWDKFLAKKFNNTQPYLIEIMFSIKSHIDRFSIMECPSCL